MAETQVAETQWTDQMTRWVITQVVGETIRGQEFQLIAVTPDRVELRDLKNGKRYRLRVMAEQVPEGEF